MAALLLRVAPWAACVGLALLVLTQHDQLVTWRLKDKDQQAVAFNLRRDILDRDAKIRGRATDEAADRGQADGVCTAEISTSFQKGVAVGRAVERHASSPVLAAAGGQPAPRIVRDYREAWAAGAYAPGS